MCVCWRPPGRVRRRAESLSTLKYYCWTGLAILLSPSLSVQLYSRTDDILPFEASPHLSIVLVLMLSGCGQRETRY